MLDTSQLRDPHSYVIHGIPTITHIDWCAQVRFTEKIIVANAIYTFDRAGETILDTRNIDIEAVRDPDEDRSLGYGIDNDHPILGRRLKVTVPESRKVLIKYRTRPGAKGLQWLSPNLTSGKMHPIMFSQGQPHHACTYLPCQNTPGVRFTYTARLQVPSGLRGLMAAGHVSKDEREDSTVESWQMDQPIPSYLFSFAVGQFEEERIGPRTMLYGEAAIMEAAAKEFGSVEEVICAAEKIFGPYEWEDFNILVLPNSFPYGGMENPRLTFLTPTVINGDGTGIRVLAHELAHAWTGNMVTNANINHFWINEGFTTWAEWRIIEALEGPDAMELVIATAMIGLLDDFKKFITNSSPEYTRLQVDIPTDVDPDSLYSQVPYVKGALFVLALEREYGRDVFDPFIRSYIKRFRFQSIDTCQLLSFVGSRLRGSLQKLNAKHWVLGEMLPHNAPVASSPQIDAVKHWSKQDDVPDATCTDWSAYQWMLYLGLTENKRRDADFAMKLDQRFSLSEHRHIDVRCAYLTLALKAGHHRIMGKARELVKSVGRMKFLIPIYTAMANDPGGMANARMILAEAKDSYHPIAVARVEGELDKLEARAA